MKAILLATTFFGLYFAYPMIRPGIFCFRLRPDYITAPRGCRIAPSLGEHPHSMQTDNTNLIDLRYHDNPTNKHSTPHLPYRRRDAMADTLSQSKPALPVLSLPVPDFVTELQAPVEPNLPAIIVPAAIILALLCLAVYSTRIPNRPRWEDMFNDSEDMEAQAELEETRSPPLSVRSRHSHHNRPSSENASRGDSPQYTPSNYSQSTHASATGAQTESYQPTLTIDRLSTPPASYIPTRPPNRVSTPADDIYVYQPSRDSRVVLPTQFDEHVNLGFGTMPPRGLGRYDEQSRRESHISGDMTEITDDIFRK